MPPTWLARELSLIGMVIASAMCLAAAGLLLWAIFNWGPK
jgi:hypothetical protein